MRDHVIVDNTVISEHGCIEQQLPAAPDWTETRFQSLVQNALDIITILDASGVRRYVSPAVARVLGYHSADLIGTNAFTLVQSDDVVPTRRLFDEALARPGAQVQAEFRVQRQDGSWCWLDAVATNLIDEPSVGGVVINARDVTERKATETRLHASEQHAHRLAVEAQRQARELSLLDRVRTALTSAVDLPVLLHTVVDAIAATFGYTQVSLYLVEVDMLVLVHQVGYDRVLDRIPVSTGISGRVVRTGTPVFLEDVRTDPAFLGAIDGIVSEVTVPLRDSERIAGTLNVESTNGMALTEADLRLMVALAEHVTIALGRARLDQERREEEARFRSLVQNASDLIAILEADGTRRYISPAVERLLGYPPDRLVGKSVLEIIHPDDRPEVHRFFAESVDDPTCTPIVEVRLRHRDGSWRWFEARGSNQIANASVRGIVVNSRDISERKALEEQLARSALTDPLTQLPNRALFLDRLGQALVRTAHDGSEVAVLFLDLDRFKVINDSLGHDAGDRALVVTGRRLAASLRPGDTVARFGGDEFIILLEGPSSREAIDIAGRILDDLRVPLRVNGHDAVIDASIGIAVSNADLRVPGDLLRAADTALYRAKAAGRGSAVVFAPDMYAAAVLRLDWETDLRSAIDGSHFQLHYQPEVEVATGRVIALEALVRWDRPGHGPVDPEDFIPVAEDTGLILPVGQWVMEEACRQAQTWPMPSPAATAPMVSVNVSAHQIRQPEFVALVERVLAETGLAGHRLQLEVTERVFVDDAAATAQVLRGLKTLGVSLAIDDFGVGYSSVSYLRRLPVDTLKIDRSFVSGTGSDAEDWAIVAAITSLAHALGMKVTVEGIETAEQLARATSIGCDRVQGYHLGRPLEAGVVAALLISSLSDQAPMT
jgi:diguanylate cyclase (GGDEF)-like protein/PAS domain S-box-containing protein